MNIFKMVNSTSLILTGSKKQRKNVLLLLTIATQNQCPRSRRLSELGGAVYSSSVILAPSTFPNTVRPILLKRVLLAPSTFPNTMRPILLKRLLRLLSPLSLACTPRAFHVPQHHASYITQVPAMQATSVVGVA